MSPSQSPLPERLKGSERGTWAQTTIVERFPDILQRTLRENEFSPPVERRLRDLAQDIPSAPIRHLRDPIAPDSKAWREYITPVEGMSWLEVSWFFAEHYFYRRIMEAVGYFAGGPDPFQRQKEQGLASSWDMIYPLAGKIQRWLETNLDPEAVGEMIYLNLWGNQADLSLWPADSRDSPAHGNLEQAQRHLLANDRPRALSRLKRIKGEDAVIDFIVDNAGFELASDLAFADLLLSGEWAGEVRFHLKGHPTFVSDAVRKDVIHTITRMQDRSADHTSRLGSRLEGHLQHSRLTLWEDFFWNSPLDFWSLPGGLDDALAQADLLISKGDANYRRLLGDRHWPYHTPFTEVVDYLPLPLLALRTLKAEVVVGLSRKVIKQTRQQDPDWMVNGRWGVIQYAAPRSGQRD